MLWDCLWVNATLATFTEEKAYGLISNAAIASHQGKIVWLGAESDCPAQAKQRIDCQGRVITPGFIDSHTHLVYSGNRADEFEQRLQGDSYEAIAKRGGGIVGTVAMTREASFESLYQQSAQRLKAMMSQGVTTVEIKSGYGLDLETEIKMLKVARQLGEDFPIRVITTCLAAHTLPPEFKNRADDYIDLVCQDILPAVREANLADFVDVFCESIAFSLAQTKKVFDAAMALGFKIKCHAEQLSNLGASQLAANYQATSVEHCEYTDDQAIKALAANNTTVVLLPGAYYFLKETKAPPIASFRAHGCNIALATDCNPGSSPCLSLPLMMNMACVLWGLTPVEALHGVTRHGAKALAQEGGQLKIGLPADFAIWDIQHPRDLVYGFGQAALHARVVAGIQGE